MDTIGGRIRDLRKENGLTQSELAERFGVDRSTIASWEINRREVDLETLKKLAILFDVRIDFLLCATDERNFPATIALSRSDDPDSDLPEEALKQIEDFREYIRQKYKKPE
jgi:transcriptional regulator with XRE-family HTH domain